MINIKALFKTVVFVLSMGALFILVTLAVLLVAIFPYIWVVAMLCLLTYMVYQFFLKVEGR